MGRIVQSMTPTEVAHELEVLRPCLRETVGRQYACAVPSPDLALSQPARRDVIIDDVIRWVLQSTGLLESPACPTAEGTLTTLCPTRGQPAIVQRTAVARSSIGRRRKGNPMYRFIRTARTRSAPPRWPDPGPTQAPPVDAPRRPQALTNGISSHSVV